MIEFIGYLASAGAMAMWLPQVVRAFRRRHDSADLAGISTGAYAVALLFNGLLIAYGSLSHSVPVVAAGSVNVVCSLIILALTATRRTSPAAKP